LCHHGFLTGQQSMVHASMPPEYGCELFPACTAAKPRETLVKKRLRLSRQAALVLYDFV
jgi:hypothetical protein